MLLISTKLLLRQIKLVDFEIVDKNFYGCILVDKNTNVMYYWITCNSGGITPIYNEDGSLKLYEE